MRKAVLAFRTRALCDAGLLDPGFFDRNDRLEVLETFDIAEEFVTQIVRVWRRDPVPTEAELEARAATWEARYRLSYVQVLRRDAERGTFTVLVKQRTSRALQGILRRLHLEAFPTPPIVLQPDESLVAFCAREDELSRVLQLLRELSLPYEVRSVGPYSPPEVAGLTPRQREILRLALELGYYEVPARVTQAELAGLVGVSRAAMSKALRRAEGRAVQAIAGGA